VRFDGGAQCGLHLGGGDDTTALLHGLFFFSSCFAGSKEAGSRKHKVVHFASAKPEGLPPHLGPILVFSIGSKMSQNHHTKDLGLYLCVLHRAGCNGIFLGKIV
jgi:hypothetical protein